MTTAKAFQRALAFFPKWMNLRRRPYTSNSGKLLDAILSEIDYIESALEEYRKDFFLVHYIGREEEILSILYLAHIGPIENIDDIKINNSEYQNFLVTDDITIFQNTVKSIYYQDGYLFIRQQFVTDDTPAVQYTYNQYIYSIKWNRYQVWNIFDEFAWFAGLERFENETNTELSNRVRKTFANRTNVTKQGLINAITNALINSSEYDITFEQPTEENMALPDDIYGTIFERMAQFNKDLARTKQWDTTYWENSFKQMRYIPHVWDAPVSVYQDGVGYNDALAVRFTDDLQAESTTVSVTGYQKSSQSIRQYLENNTIIKELSLQLKKYKNILEPIPVQYKITATSVEELDPSSITISSYQTMAGRNIFVLDDLVEDTQNIAKIQRGTIDPNTEYMLQFKSTGSVGTMQIDQCDLITEEETSSLLKEQGQFVFSGDRIQNKDVKYYTDSIKNLKTYTNLIDTESGFTIEDLTKEATFAVDVSNLQGQYIDIQHNCPPTNIASNSTFIESNGFSYQNNSWIDNSSSTQHTLTIHLSCTYISFSLAKADDPIRQGTIQFSVQVNGKPDGALLTQWAGPNTYEQSFDTLTDVVIVIQKNGQYPVQITNILASRYVVNIETDMGALFETPFGLLIPQNATTLYGTFRTYDAQPPSISYIYVGPDLTNAIYTIDNISADTAARLSIRTNCIVSLINKTTQETISPFTTSTLYQNNTQDNGIVYIDTSQFTGIISSTPEIYTESVRGVIRNYIIVAPGESIDTITIIGESTKLLQTTRLQNILPSYTHIYGCQAIAGILIDSDKGQEIFHVTRNLFPEEADTFIVANAKYKTVFVQDADRNTQLVANTLTGEFEEVYWIPDTSTEYIAYNTQQMFQKEKRYISITYSFSPILQPSTLVLYQLSDIVSDNYAATVVFEKLKDNQVIQESWSLGTPDQGIYISLDMNTANTDQYQLDIVSMSWPFVIKNTIPLEPSYPINGNQIELAQYILIPPDGMQVDYTTNTVAESFYIEEDGFNKLTYSNVVSVERVSIDNTILPASNYTLLEEAGIIIWNTDAHIGQKAEIVYSYKNPTSLSFTSLDSIYGYVDVTIDAYEAINKEPLLYIGVKAGDVITLPFENAERLSVRCDNDGFTVQANAEKTQLTILLLSTDNKIAVHSGYYYDGGKEYWKFANIHKETGDHYDGVTLERVDKINDSFVLSQESTNHITNSAFISSGSHDIYCIADFKKNKHIPEISSLRRNISACDSYTGWYCSHMDVSFTEYAYRNVLSFTDKGDGFAVLDITPYCFENAYIYCDMDDGLQAYLAYDIDFDKELYTRKTIYAELVKKLYSGNGKLDDYNTRRRQYLVIIGSGVLREIIIKPYDESDNIDTIHERNIDKFNFDIKEQRLEGSIANLYFDSAFSSVTDLEFDRQDTLLVGTDVDYGLTLLLQSDFDKCQITNISYASSMFKTGEEAGIIITEPLELENKDAIGILHVAINQILLSDTFKGFTIELLTSDYSSGPYQAVQKKEDCNMLSVNRRYLKRYIRARITMPQKKCIDTISFYAEYDTQDALPHIHYHQEGEMVSRIFDTITPGNYQLHKLCFDHYHDTAIVYVRACRQNDTETVWTDWTHIEFDESGIVTNNIIYRNYRMFQIRIHLIGENASIRLQSIQLKAVE